MTQYRKKTVVIEAIRYAEDGDNVDEVITFIADGGGDVDSDNEIVLLTTPEGVKDVHPGDWVLKGVKGEFYPCKNDIFEATYEAVAE